MLARALAVFVALFASDAWAVSIYAEAGGAVSQFHGNTPFFGPGTDNPSGLGYGVDFGAYVSFSGGSAPTDFQLGFQERLSAGSLGSVSYSIISFYPTARLQISRLYLSGGVSPWVYRGTTLSDFKPVQSALAYDGEAGFLIPITPRFSFGVGASVEFVSVGGTSGPAPVIQGFGLMRVYWGVGSTGGGDSSSGTSNEWRGWRYPFGYIR
jgi:hypothetical protein